MHEGKDLALKLCWITVLQSNVLALNTVSAQMTAVPSNGLTHTVKQHDQAPHHHSVLNKME